MSDLGLGIEYSDVLEAIKAVTNLEDSYARMVQQIIAENNRLKVLEKNADLRFDAEARAMKKIEAEAQKHYDSLVSKRFAFQRRMEAQQTREFTQLRRQAEEENSIFDKKAADAERAKQAYLSLAGRYDPLIRGANEFAKAQEILNEALKRGAIDADQYKKQLAKVREATLHGANDFTQFGVKALLSGKNLGYHGQVMQQFGYQMQDFIVQVQSGTSAWTAFGQQGSQMAGIFGPLGATIGIVIALSSAIGGTLVRSLGSFNKSLEETSKAAKEAFDAIKQSSSVLGQAVSQDLADAFKVAKSDLQGFLDVWNQLEQKTLEKTLAGVREGLKSSVAGTDQSIFDTNWNAQAVLEAPKELAAIFDTLRSNTLPELVNEYIEANKRISEATTITKEQRDLAQQKLMETAKEIGIYDEIIEKQKEVSTSQKESNSSEIAYIDALIEKYATLHEKELAAIEEAAQKEKDRLRKAYEYYADSRKAGEELAKVDLATALAGATTNANGLATAMFNTLGYAQAIKALFGFGSTTTYSEVFQGPSTPPGWQEERNKLKALGAPPSFEDPDLDGIPGVSSDTTKGGSGGGGKGTVDRIAALDREYQQRLKMVGLFGEQLKQEEAYQAVVKAVGDDVGSYSEEFLRAKAAEIAKTQELIDLEASRKDIYDTVEKSMNDVFMSMADGTKTVKEAFSSMARSIVSELYKVLVVKQAVNSIMGFVGSSGIIPGLASGSNTVTKVNDAVISPKGQIISTSPEDFLIATKRPQDLGKSASGGSNSVSEGGVVVHQSFNISGSDQATVQQALARAMPAIVTATKSAIVDARKRGSSELRGAFG